MADGDQSQRTLSWEQANAIAADRATRETAEYKAKVDELTREKAELQSKLDVSEAAVSTEKTARETAEKALQDFKTETEQKAAIAARREARVAKVRETAKHLKDDFFTDERRDRWAAMDDDAFSTYVAEIAALAPAANSGSAPVPRESAMQATAPAPTGSGTARTLFDLRRGVSTSGQ